MTSRERMLAAIRHEVPDRIPLAILEIEDVHKFARWYGLEHADDGYDIGHHDEVYAQLGIDGFRSEVIHRGDKGVAPNGEPLNEWGAVAKKDYGAEHWRRFLKPRYAKLFDIGKRRGKYVWFHSCGDITEVLPDLIDIGMDVWETVQLHTLPMSPRELKKEYGRHVTFFGAVNTQRLPFAHPDEIRAEVARCIEALGHGGGYICGPDHGIRADVPYENIVALYETARDFRRTGYTMA